MTLPSLILAGLCLGGGLDARPEIRKVEPPGWWPGHSVNPVRLLLRGQGLEGAEVTIDDTKSQVSRLGINETATALFLDLWIDPASRPGRRSLTVATPRGRTSAAFEILEPLPRAGRFAGFTGDDALYLIMPDRFANGDKTNDDPPASPGLTDRRKAHYYHGGDLRGIQDHLPYLKDLGITTLWLTPIYDNSNHLNTRQLANGEATTDYHGYHAVDFYGLEEHFGALADLKSLVDRAHAAGLRVVLDQVANHTGPEHPWVKDPPTRTWWNGSESAHLENHWQIWTLMDPHATPQLQRDALEGWFVNVLPDLNQSDPEVARYLVQNTLWWIGVSGVDGIREDTLPYVPRVFWREWRAALRREYPDLSVVGEVSDPDPAIVAFFQGGALRSDGVDTGVESLFDYPLYYSLRRAFAQGRQLREVAAALSHDWLYPSPTRLVTFLGLHDTPRFMSEGGATIDGLKLALTFLMTARGIPLLYYGDEIGMSGGDDPDNRRDFPGGFPGDGRSAFTPEGRTADEEAIHAHVRKLLSLRKELEPLRRGGMRELLVSDQAWVFVRSDAGESVVVALNNASEPVTLDIPSPATGLSPGTVLEDRLGTLSTVTLGASLRLKLPPRSGSLLVPRRR